MSVPETAVPAPPAPAATRPRVPGVDVLRAGAALAVLAIHAYNLGGHPVPVKAQHAWQVPLIDLASGVWLFFAISGYVICRPFVERLVSGAPAPRTGAYLVRRISRIFPLYWLALAALIALQGTQGARDWQLALHVLLLNNLAPGRQAALFPAAWTLTLEFLFYLSVPALAWLLGRGRRRVAPERLVLVVCLSWGASILFNVGADLLGDGLLGLWLRGSLPAVWQMFCPGILVAVAPHLQRSRRRRGAAAAGAAAAALVAAAILSAAAPLRFGVVPYELLADAGRPLFAVGFGIVLAAVVRESGRRLPPWALRLGVVSYGIYLIHPVLATLLVRAQLVPARGGGAAAFLMNLLCMAALTIPLALVSWRVLEAPAIRLGRRWSALL